MDDDVHKQVLIKFLHQRQQLRQNLGTSHDEEDTFHWEHKSYIDIQRIIETDTVPVSFPGRGSCRAQKIHTGRVEHSVLLS